MNKSDIITDILHQIRAAGWHYEITDNLSPQLHAFIDPNRKLAIFNRQTASIADYIHEEVHIELAHNGRLSWNNGNDERNPHENEANSEMINRIVNFQIQNDWPLDVYTIMAWYGIPPFLEPYLTDELTRQHQ